MKIKKEQKQSQEVQAIWNWCRKKKVTCQWVLDKHGKTRTLCLNRGATFIYSESMTNDQAIALSYQEMKELLVTLYKRLKESED